ncbi:hypothetical protein WEI85_31150 [Actinomycetes bacterium KLBMP 9797]
MLLERQERLQREAEGVLSELDLPALLSRAGRVELIGSVASGLMIWRDLDISIFVAPDRHRRVAEILGTLLADPRVLDVHYANETGARSPSGGTHDQRYYAVLRYLPPGGETWKIDLSFWIDSGPRGEFLDGAALRARLTSETRLAILRIKDEWHRLDSYPDQIGGIDVYDAVLNHGVRTPGEFDAYLRARNLPTHPDRSAKGKIDTTS